ncbi:MAG: OmpA family protein [Bacteroidota bacterium]
MKKTYGLFIIIAFLMSACVTSKKYNELLSQQKKCADDLSLSNNKNQELSTSVSDMETELKKLKADHKKLVEDTTTLSSNLSEITEKHNKLKEDYEIMQNNLNTQLSGNKSDLSKTLSDLQKTQENLINQGTLLNTQKKELEQLNKALELKEAKLLELQSVLNKKDSAVNALKNKISEALLGYENNGLTIVKKNGKVYVSLDEKLLFASGSYTISTPGAEALKKLSKVLESNADINVMIEGHTDDVPYNGVGQLKDNWDLSVMRATSVVKILLQGSTIDPARIIAAGRSNYSPIDASKTKEARTKNRRTEIILTPKLDELFKMLESN